MSDDTIPLPVIHFVPSRSERWLVVALAVTFLGAGAVLAFSCLTLANVADQINSTPMCRRL